MTRHGFVLGFLCGALLAGACLAATSGAPSSLEVTGVMSVTPVLAHSCIAAWVPMENGQALAGLRWYNNDGTVIFPRLLLAEGAEGSPGALSAAVPIAQTFAGATSAWSEVSFEEPVVSQGEGLYAIFELPEGAEQTGVGDGGGPGVGYVLGGTGPLAWVSEDGTDWVAMHPDFRLAAEPVLVGGASNVRVLSSPTKSSAPEPNPGVLAIGLSPARPNPFNPLTQLQFTLRESGPVSLSIYNVRGQLVRELVKETCAAGEHTVEWRGDDGQGRTQPSGVYVAQMHFGTVVLSQRLLLVR